MLPFYSDQTMWGPQGDPNKERPRLKPGDRLTDGRVFAGNNPEAVLLAELARVEDALRPLDIQRAELLAKLCELDPQKYKASGSPQGDGEVVGVVKKTTAPEGAPAATPAKKKTKNG